MSITDKKSYSLKDSIKVTKIGEVGDFFNLQFHRATQPHKGCGVYVILFKNEQTKLNEVVYLGKFQPLDKDIFSYRWLRHIQTMTLRGARVGFGSIQKRKKMLTLANKPNLISMINSIPDARFQDTGVTMALNRVIFANENWDDFCQRNDTNILNGFSFVHFKFEGVTDPVKAKTIASDIEKKLLKIISPVCNKEYKQGGNRTNSTYEKVSSEVECLLNELKTRYSIHEYK